MENTTIILLVIACMAICVSTLSLVLILIFYKKIKKINKYLTGKQSKGGLNNRGYIQDEISAVVLKSSEIKEWILELIQKSITPSDDISTETFNSIVETVLLKVNKNHPQEKDILKVEENTGKKYAEAYDSKTDTFYSISHHPTDTTIYELNIEDFNEEGTFTLSKSAYKRVSECRDFLEGASEVSGSGESIRIISQGRISLENGRYVVTKPLEIRFE